MLAFKQITVLSLETSGLISPPFIMLLFQYDRQSIQNYVLPNFLRTSVENMT